MIEITATAERRSLAEFEGYSVDQMGKVWSQGRWEKGWQQVASHIHTNGYPVVSLWRNNKQYRRYVHRLVARAFLGVIPEGMHVAHMDGTKNNNRLSNLRVVTCAENNSHMIEHGTRIQGVDKHNAKLTPKAVKAIRRWSEDGHSQPKICDLLMRTFGVDVARTTVQQVVEGRSWSHV